jgi:co-chaperonin GroES (HSP10)
MKPVRCFITFVPVDVPNVSAGGILAPESFTTAGGREEKAAKRARVTAVGPGKMTPAGFREVCCKPGDYVQLMPNAYINAFMLNGVMTYVVDDEYIAGILEESDVVTMVPEKEEKKIVTPKIALS